LSLCRRDAIVRAMSGESLESLGTHLARNLKEIRELRGLTQAQLARLCEVPRSTIANVESGGSNPTLAVLARLAAALHLSLEELLARPRARCQLFAPGDLPENVYRRAGVVRLRHLLPHPIPGMAIERMELEPGARLVGSPHAPGTHEYLACERGRLSLRVSGEAFVLERGAVAAFAGDQRHSYANEGRTPAVGYSVVSLAPIAALGAR
jgi:transcriptional regulator with XRE-family HTH domain